VLELGISVGVIRLFSGSSVNRVGGFGGS
jgi:hypothetical protein